jgi:hypothetical protein
MKTMINIHFELEPDESLDFALRKHFPHLFADGTSNVVEFPKATDPVSELNIAPKQRAEDAPSPYEDLLALVKLVVDTKGLGLEHVQSLLKEMGAKKISALDVEEQAVFAERLQKALGE